MESSIGVVPLHPESEAAASVPLEEPSVAESPLEEPSVVASPLEEPSVSASPPLDDPLDVEEPLDDPELLVVVVAAVSLPESGVDVVVVVLLHPPAVNATTRAVALRAPVKTVVR
jgi:hypothetical protein